MGLFSCLKASIPHLVKGSKTDWSGQSIRYSDRRHHWCAVVYSCRSRHTTGSGSDDQRRRRRNGTSTDHRQCWSQPDGTHSFALIVHTKAFSGVCSSHLCHGNDCRLCHLSVFLIDTEMINSLNFPGYQLVDSEDKIATYILLLRQLHQ